MNLYDFTVYLKIVHSNNHWDMHDLNSVLTVFLTTEREIYHYWFNIKKFKIIFIIKM